MKKMASVVNTCDRKFGIYRTIYTHVCAVNIRRSFELTGRSLLLTSYTWYRLVVNFDNT